MEHGLNINIFKNYLHIFFSKKWLRILIGRNHRSVKHGRFSTNRLPGQLPSELWAERPVLCVYKENQPMWPTFMSDTTCWYRFHNGEQSFSVVPSIVIKTHTHKKKNTFKSRTKLHHRSRPYKLGLTVAFSYTKDLLHVIIFPTSHFTCWDTIETLENTIYNKSIFINMNALRNLDTGE